MKLFLCNKSEIGAGPCFAKGFLIVFNIVFTLAGVAMMIFGCLIRFGSPIVHSYLELFLERTASGSVSDVDLQTMLGDLAMTFIVLGTIIFVIGGLGCTGACCQVKVLLVLYASLVILILVAEIVAVILLTTVKEQIDAALRGALRNTLQNSYHGTNSKDIVSLAWNTAMTQGCYKALQAMVMQQSDVMIGVGVAVLVVEILVVALAFVVCCSVNNGVRPL